MLTRCRVFPYKGPDCALMESAVMESVKKLTVQAGAAPPARTNPPNSGSIASCLCLTTRVSPSDGFTVSNTQLRTSEGVIQYFIVGYI